MGVLLRYAKYLCGRVYSASSVGCRLDCVVNKFECIVIDATGALVRDRVYQTADSIILL